MKKIFIISILLGGMMSSCVWERADSYMNENGHSGKQAFRYLERNVSVCLADYFDIALRMSKYLAAPQEEWQQLEDQYFPECKIRQQEAYQWIGLLGQDTVFKLKTDGRLLSEKNACWVIGKGSIDQEGEEICCIDKGKWRVETKGLRMLYERDWSIDAIFQVELRGEDVPDSFKNFDWVVTGAGKCLDQSSQILIHFETKESLIRVKSSEDLFQEGGWEILAEDLEKQLKERIEVTIEALPGKERCVRIVYRGKTYVYMNGQ